MPPSIHRIALLLTFIAIILIAACKKKKEEPAFVRSKEEPAVVLDSVVQTAFNSFHVSGAILHAWWVLNREHGILYSTDPNPQLGNSTRIRLASTEEEFIRVKHDMGELPDGKNLYVRLYVKGDTNRVWYSKSIMVTTQTFRLQTMANNKVGRGMKTEIRIAPQYAQLPPDKLEIYLGPYKAAINYKRSNEADGWLYFTVPDNIPSGKYPITGKLFNLTVLAEDTIEVLTGKWSILSEPPFKGRGRMAHFVWNNKGFVVGGTPGALYLPMYREVWQFDIATRVWTRKNDFPIDLYDAVAFNVNNRIFVMGGATNRPLPDRGKILQPDIWEYDPINDTWANKGPHPQQKTARSLMAGTVLNNRIYVGTGSTHLENYHSTNQVSNEWMMYDPATNSWTNLAPVSQYGLRGGACFNDGQYIYMVGGDNINGHITGEVKRYNVQANTWEVLPPMPTASRSQSTVVYIQNVPYLFGGVRQTTTTNIWRNLIDLWSFNGATRQWTQYLYYNSDQGLVILPPGGPTIIYPGAQPAVFPTANGFIIYGGSVDLEGIGHSHSLVEYKLE